MKTNNSIIAFYVSLASILSDETFVESSAEALSQLAEENKADLSGKDFSVKFLREAYEEFHDKSRDLDIMEGLTEEAFADLAPYMKDINARKAFRRLTEMSGTYEIQDLFAHVSSVRHFGKDKDGMAVVTLVVNSFRELKDLLKNPRDSEVEVGHLSPSEE